MTLAVLIGETVSYTLLATGALAYVIVPAAIYLWWRHTSRAPLALAAGYFALTSLACLLCCQDSGGPAWLVAVSFVLAMPWSLLSALSSSWPESWQALSKLMMAGGGINAAVIHVAARRVVRLEQQYIRHLQAKSALARRR